MMFLSTHNAEKIYPKKIDDEVRIKIKKVRQVSYYWKLNPLNELIHPWIKFAVR